MKLNYPRTMLIGLAFLSICAFWQLYDATVPLMLRDTFHMGDAWAGVVMAGDNVLALFMLPLFGLLSDRTRTRFGRRMPYIALGTLLAAALAALLGFMDRAGSLQAYLIVLCALLLAMGAYRSPAVALMPDLTPKPLRSKGNAIINLMGALGGIAALALIAFAVPSMDGRADYRLAYALTALLMLVSVGALAFLLRENELRVEGDADDSKGKRYDKLPRPALVSLVLILVSVFFWFMGYNAVTTAFTKYATQVWNMPLSQASLCLMLATGGAVISYLPVGMLSSRFGRKKMILVGVALMVACFGFGALIRGTGALAYVLFVLIGFSWAAINVNSYPMVVELAGGGNVGKYTGFYYTFSMAAQIATPVLSGLLLERVGYWTLFPYAALMVLASLFTMLKTRHGDSAPDAPASALEGFDAQD